MCVVPLSKEKAARATQILESGGMDVVGEKSLTCLFSSSMLMFRHVRSSAVMAVREGGFFGVFCRPPLGTPQHGVLSSGAIVLTC